eukprot:m.86038 g.86038  ORF g.86038 m.86038 type:complete len:291 (+) comp25920_c0_seq1:63-935(+)
MFRVVKAHRFFGALHQCTFRGFATAVGSPTTVTVSDCGRFGTLTLSRPDKHNALSPDTMEAIKEATSELAKQPEIRALFLKAEGRSFCAGGDLKHMRATADFTKEQNIEDAMKLSGVFDALYRFPRPVIAMVEGNTFGGGLGLISACDMAFGLKGLKFSFTEIKLGVIPATISPYVIEKIGITAARRYFLTAEQFDSEAAEKIGLLNEIVATSDDLLAIEEKLKLDFSATSTDATHATKELISELASRSVDLATREWTAGKLAEVRDSVDGREGMSSFIEKRKPRWVVSP